MKIIRTKSKVLILKIQFDGLSQVKLITRMKLKAMCHVYLFPLHFDLI